MDPRVSIMCICWCLCKATQRLLCLPDGFSPVLTGSSVAHLYLPPLRETMGGDRFSYGPLVVSVTFLLRRSHGGREHSRNIVFRQPEARLVNLDINRKPVKCNQQWLDLLCVGCELKAICEKFAPSSHQTFSFAFREGKAALTSCGSDGRDVV